ncbi:uncharacterized protein LOC134251279 [Saccostrea cucullata]|uniref:uncharacterized protein LOC134251279 n=1 Tax=Saccostrea cuccullata TaxID=36930 RepID=UPI002ED2E27E
MFNVVDPPGAKFTTLNTKLLHVRRADNRLLYEYNADAFSSLQSLWVNRKDYNYFLIHFEAIFNPDLSFPAFYIQNFSIGIVSAYARVVLAKIGRTGGTTDVSLNTTLSCPGTFSRAMPYNGQLICKISYDQFNRVIEDGDNLTILAVTETSGFRNLRNMDNFFRKDNYTSAISHRSLNFIFDFTKPKHCSDSNNCALYELLPLKLSNDASKDPFTFEINGWNDIPSGIKTYFLEVHNLKKKTDSDALTEEAPMHPLSRKEGHIPEKPFEEFTPPDPGVYSFILQVTDKANNSEFARQIAIYDPNSTITTTEESNLYVSSAEKLSNYSWQSRCSTVEITWRDYFRNSYQVENHFFLPVENFPIQVEGGELKELKNEVVKYVKEVYDDHDGKRTVSAVKHVNGITEFEVYYTFISYRNTPTTASNNFDNITETMTTANTTESGNFTFTSGNFENTITSEIKSTKNKYTIPSSTMSTVTVMTSGSPCIYTMNGKEMENQWNKIHDITNSTFVLKYEWKDGDSINISVRARDIVNNRKTNSRLVNFDGSPPSASDALFTKNVGNKTYDYSSSVRISASDKHSGVRQVRWRIRYRNKQNNIHKEGFFLNNPVQIYDCSTSDDCYCIPMGECYKKDTLNSLTSFNGIEAGVGIKNLQKESIGNEVKFTWDNIPSCYKVADITIFVYIDCDKSKPPREIALPTDKTEYTLSSLESGKEYCVEVISNNTGKTAALMNSWSIETPPAIPISLIAGVSAVLAILLGIILAFVVLWRTGRLNTETKRRLTMYLKRPVTMMMGKRKTGFYNGHFQDEEIYDFGRMVFSDNEGWLYTFDDITLKGKIKSGDFADIYLAELCKKDVIVAKILKEDYNEEDRLVLQAKISFFATEVPPHENIIQFLGSVLNHPLVGPYMLLEYCELGQLKEWLIGQKDKINDDMITSLCKIVHGIAKGMEALAIKGIVHKRLTARNILLTSNLVPKVAGFGPTPEEGENELNKKEAMERKPIKWLAPECYGSMKTCTSISDVWAFGVVIWETFSTGQNPYPGIDWKVLTMKVKNGYRMSAPEFCPETHAVLMRNCWETKPEDRATFTNIVTTLDRYYDARFPDSVYATDAV